jgi:CRISPR-associated protein Cas2
MWVLVLFDLPTDTKDAKKAYSIFRKFLLEQGFLMLQFSVYARTAASEEAADAKLGRVQRHLPKDGEVRIMMLTDKQFARMRVFYGKRRRATEQAPSQLEFF